MTLFSKAIITAHDVFRKGVVQLPESKSISNRLLIIQSLATKNIEINNLSTSHDTQILKRSLKQIEEQNEGIINVEDAGTAFRFLTAYLAIIKGDWVLTGSERMKERPIKALVEALHQIGADIEYLEKSGFPPLKITGKKLDGGNINIDQGISSQFITSLLLIAPFLQDGLCIKLKGYPVSQPYVEMTLLILNSLGVQISRSKHDIIVKRHKFSQNIIVVEKDWSSASYWYALTALSKGDQYYLPGLKKSMLQGDSILPEIFKSLGVNTAFLEEGVLLSKIEKAINHLSLNLSDYPDIAQTIAVVCAGLKVRTKLSGLKTLKIKETDRMNALQSELRKLEVNVSIPDDQTILIEPSEIIIRGPVNTYRDHRMAMAFAPLALITKKIEIIDPLVVAKSYPGFWIDLENNQFEVKFN